MKAAEIQHSVQTQLSKEERHDKNGKLFVTLWAILD